ncbi:unnamed protein product [Lepidochelys kempii]
MELGQVRRGWEGAQPPPQSARDTRAVPPRSAPPHTAAASCPLIRVSPPAPRRAEKAAAAPHPVHPDWRREEVLTPDVTGHGALREKSTSGPAFFKNTMENKRYNFLVQVSISP